MFIRRKYKSNLSIEINKIKFINLCLLLRNQSCIINFKKNLFLLLLSPNNVITLCNT